MSFIFLISFYGREQFNCSSWASQVALVVMNTSASAGDTKDISSIPGSGRSPGGGNGNSFQYSYLKNSVDRGAWQVTVHRVAKSWTWLKCSTCTVAYPSFIDIFTYLVSLKKVIRIFKNYFSVCTEVTFFCCLFSFFHFMSLSFLKWLLVLDCQFIFMNDDQFNLCKWIPFTL